MTEPQSARFADLQGSGSDFVNRFVAAWIDSALDVRCMTVEYYDTTMGIAQETQAEGADTEVITEGLAEGLSGFTAGELVWAATDGTLTVEPKGNRLIGTALSATQVLLLRRTGP